MVELEVDPLLVLGEVVVDLLADEVPLSLAVAVELLAELVEDVPLALDLLVLPEPDSERESLR